MNLPLGQDALKAIGNQSCRLWGGIAERMRAASRRLPLRRVPGRLRNSASAASCRYRAHDLDPQADML